MKNKGFSFIELLVAVAILGLISLPITSSFVLAARIEAKSAILSKMNDAADDVMMLVAESEMMDAYGSALSVDSHDCDSDTFEIEHILRCIYANAGVLEGVDKTVQPDFSEYTLIYNGYTVALRITPCDGMTFSRVDLTIDYEANGSTYQVTRKGVLSNAP